MARVQYAQFGDLLLQPIAERARSLVTCHCSSLRSVQAVWWTAAQFGELLRSLVNCRAVWWPATAAHCGVYGQFGILPLQLGILPLQLGILPLHLGILPLQFGILPLQFGILPRSLINVSPRTTTRTTTTKQNLDPRCTYVQTRVKNKTRRHFFCQHPCLGIL
jgi:hypothetical protein